MIDHTNISGLILAGGLGRRMSADGTGTNKALLEFRGEPMLSHVIKRLKPQVASIVLNVNQQTECFEQFGLTIVADKISGFAGPLAGIHAGLSHAPGPWLLIAPCDSPFLPANLASRLAAAIEPNSRPIAYARAGARTHPVFALISCDLADDLARFLADGGRKIDQWYAAHNAAIVDFDDEPAFRNINTPDDLARFEPT